MLSGMPADVLAVADQHIERVKLHFVIVPAGMQPVEVGNAIHAEQHALAVRPRTSSILFQSAAR
jgi:hypothetical protein